MLKKNVITLHSVCAVHRGMFGTLGDIMSTVEDTMSTLGCVQYTGDIMSTVGDTQRVLSTL